ncbi:MAG: hypothetical protein ACFCUG_04665 [Thiotrichales bacterium]
MGKKLTSGFNDDAYLTVEIRTTSAVLAAQIDVLRAKRRHGRCCDSKSLVSRSSAKLGQCVYCLADRIRTHAPEARERAYCVATPTLFGVVEHLDPRLQGAGLGLTTALERLSGALEHLETLDDEQLVILRDYLVDVSNQNRGANVGESRLIPGRSPWNEQPTALR